MTKSSRDILIEDLIKTKVPINRYKYKDELEIDGNMPVSYLRIGGVVYGIHGTSSINCVEKLLEIIRDQAGTD